VPAIAVGQPANSTQFGSSLFLCAAAPARPLLSVARQVGQPHRAATAGSIIEPDPSRFCTAKSGPAIFAIGVGHPDEPESLSDVRRPDARSAQISRPDGVARCFQVSLYKVEPIEAVLARNLLSKDDWRA
jgi:hypothetical protein